MRNIIDSIKNKLCFFAIYSSPDLLSRDERRMMGFELVHE